MKNQLLILIFLVCYPISFLFSQPATEVYLFDLAKIKKGYTLSNPVNISQNEGYDNQPAFLPDGSGILFVQNFEGQTDVMRYDISSGQKTRLTKTSASEYSPTPMPDGQQFSTIILEKDGTQLLWAYPLSGGEAAVVVPDLKIGYHAWIDNATLFSFVLGEPHALYLTNMLLRKNVKITENIGRSLHKIPGKKLLSFVDKKHKDGWVVKSFNPKNATMKYLALPLGEVEDLAWTPKRVILMGKGNKLYYFNPRKSIRWKEVADLSEFDLKGITRLAIHPDGSKIAIVVEE